MKKYLTFVISLILLYFVYQLGTGLWLTLTHTADFSSADTYSESSRSYWGGSWDLLEIIIVASLAYVLSQRVHTRKK
ncbi:hypothetical protein H0266_04540 [Halobacillus locisalis]|uniref:Uncharacterized protein n=1 Tax=Halobacillus locisalis TaxID=220753 RepID=A0A838CQ25_9BACI|nr:hypothetical protein [Halobacillus locisalis]MBA2174167.1 hypothetical protein [Halobacillus locisalis]